MAEKDQINVELNEKEKDEIEKNVSDKVEGNENMDSENDEGEENRKTLERKESSLNRFFSWFRGKPKEEIKEKEKETETQDENEKNETEKSEIENEKEIGEKETNELKTKNEVNEKMDKPETLKINENGVKKEGGETKNVSAIVKSQETSPNSTDRSLLKIEEEKTDKVAPLAQEEDEDIIEVTPDSRTSIDRLVPQPNRTDAVEAERETTAERKALPQDDIDAQSENKKSASVFLHLSQPTFEKRQEETADQRDKRATEHEDFIQKPHSDNNITVSAQQEVSKDENQKPSKMEDVIEEQRHDTRTETMHETWKKVEQMEPSKTYRVSYTMTTTTVVKSKDDTKPTEDDEEKLFGNHVLLSNSERSRPKYDGPPPEDLEPEYRAEEAKKDEAGTADIDHVFKMMAEDGSPPEGGVTEVTTDRQESSPETPETPEDVFSKLHNWDKEPTDWWTCTKKKRDYDEWMKPMKEGTIRRVIIPKVEIPYEACVCFLTDWKHREEWDKTFSEIKILKDNKDSKLIYCPVKKRDLTFETLDRKENDPSCYIMTWKRQHVGKEDENTDTPKGNKKELQLITHTCGIIIRPSESGDQATYITILCQLEGPVDKVLKNTYLAGHPKTWLRMLNNYYKKQQKGTKDKVVYL